jgi:hypothetical protein
MTSPDVRGLVDYFAASRTATFIGIVVVTPDSVTAYMPAQYPHLPSGKICAVIGQYSGESRRGKGVG